MSLQGGKKRLKRSDEREIVCNVYKFMKTESEVSITIRLSKVQKSRWSNTCYQKNIMQGTDGIFNSAQIQTKRLHWKVS
jgi:hypothetical protein